MQPGKVNTGKIYGSEYKHSNENILNDIGKKYLHQVFAHEYKCLQDPICVKVAVQAGFITQVNKVCRPGREVFEVNQLGKDAAGILSECYNLIDRIAENNFVVDGVRYSKEELEDSVGYFYDSVQDGLFGHPVTSLKKAHPLNDEEVEQLKAAEVFLINKKNLELALCDDKTRISLDENSKKHLIKRTLNIAFPQFRTDQEQVSKLTDTMYGKTFPSMVGILFKHIYGISLQEEDNRHGQIISKYKLAENISSVLSKNEALQHNTHYDELKVPDYEEKKLHYESNNTKEKSLDQLCSEYDSVNNEYGVANRIKQAILTIHRKIEYLRGHPNEIYSTTAHLTDGYPLDLIAASCLSVEEMCEGKMPRNTQLMALLSMLDGVEPKGKLAQVFTGEGKSIIVAMLAIIKVKQGETVDIITSSKTLAIRDFEKFKKLYTKWGITSSNNCNDSSKNEGVLPKKCYKNAGIVYGDNASFEADALLDEFYQYKTFNGRKATVAIIDEVDSILLDKSSWLCQISDSVAGMSTITPLLYLIWGEVIQNITANPITSLEELKNRYELIEKTIKEKVGTFFPENESQADGYIIPKHLKSFVDYRISYWIKSAITAAILYTHNKEYHAGQELKKITPIDYANTGEWEADMQWEDGLHQCLQILNNFPVETETLTKSFMSNYSLVKRYKIYGMSGTLGGDLEHEAISKLYGVSISKIPAFKPSQFQEKLPYLAQDQEQWKNTIFVDIMSDGKLDELPVAAELRVRERATLVICKTVKDVFELKEYLLNKGVNENEIVTYTKGDEDKAKIEKATKGKIILATNLSGRGTDIDTSAINDSGGLHVILSFLPINIRVEYQAFGRAARQGNPGTGRKILSPGDIQEHHLDGNKKLSYESIMNGRNAKENGRLKFLYEAEKVNLETKANLFKNFQNFVHGLESRLKIDYNFIAIKPQLLAIYKEYVLDEWAIFLDQVNKKKKNCSFTEFANTIETEISKIATSNPLYAMQYANALIDLSNNSFALDKAEDIYKKIGERKDISAGFAWYNRVYIAIAKNPKKDNFSVIKYYLNKAREIFKACEEKEMVLLRLQIPDKVDASSKGEIPSSPIMRVIKTMLYSIRDQLKNLEDLEKDYNEIKVEFLNPYDLAEKDVNQEEKQKDDDKKVETETIPREIFAECIKLGLKGPLMMTGVGSKAQAIFFAVVCVLVAIAAIAAIIASGGAAAPFLTLLAAGVFFGGGVAGAINAIKGAVNGDFSLNKFGKDVLIGAIVGGAAGGVGAAISAGAIPLLQGASLAVQAGVYAGIGAVSGAVGGFVGHNANHLWDVAFRGKNIHDYSVKELGMAVGIGALGGAVGGLFAPLAGQGDKALRVIFEGTLGGLAADFAVQAVSSAISGENFNIDAFQLLEAAAVGGFCAGVMHKAKKYGKKKLDQRQAQSAMPGKATISKGQAAEEKLEDSPFQKNENIYPELSKQKPTKKWTSDNPEHEAKWQEVEARMHLEKRVKEVQDARKPQVNKVLDAETDINWRGRNINHEFDDGYVGSGPRHSEFAKPRRNSFAAPGDDPNKWRKQPEIFPKGRGRDNVVPRINAEIPYKPSGEPAKLIIPKHVGEGSFVKTAPLNGCSIIVVDGGSDWHVYHDPNPDSKLRKDVSGNYTYGGLPVSNQLSYIHGDHYDMNLSQLNVDMAMAARLNKIPQDTPFSRPWVYEMKRGPSGGWVRQVNRVEKIKDARGFEIGIGGTMDGTIKHWRTS